MKLINFYLSIVLEVFQGNQKGKNRFNNRKSSRPFFIEKKCRRKGA